MKQSTSPLPSAIEMANTIMNWSNINSGSLNVVGLQTMAETLMKAFEPLQCEHEIIHDLSTDQINNKGLHARLPLGPLLRFWKRMEAPTKILLMGHMDTVFPSNHPFQRAERKSENIIQGPGVIDMKGGLCILLESLKLFEQYPNRDQLGWEVIINPDEEISSVASAPIIASRAKHHNLALLFEPGIDEAGTLAGDRRGSGRFTFVVRGKASHVGRAHHEGVSAILALAKMIQQLEALNGDHDEVTVNVGEIQGGGALNVVPDLAIGRIDVRTKTNDDEQWILEKLDQIVKKAVRQEGITVELEGKFNRKPKIVSGKTEELYKLVREVGKSLGQTIHWHKSGGCSDGNNLSEAGLPNVDSLGACGGKIHSEEEYLRIDSLIPRVELTTGILKKVCDEGF